MHYSCAIYKTPQTACCAKFESGFSGTYLYNVLAVFFDHTFVDYCSVFACGGVEYINNELIILKFYIFMRECLQNTHIFMRECAV